MRAWIIVVTALVGASGAHSKDRDPNEPDCVVGDKPCGASCIGPNDQCTLAGSHAAPTCAVDCACAGTCIDCDKDCHVNEAPARNDSASPGALAHQTSSDTTRTIIAGDDGSARASRLFDGDTFRLHNPALLENNSAVVVSVSRPSDVQVQASPLFQTSKTSGDKGPCVLGVVVNVRHDSEDMFSGGLVAHPKTTLTRTIFFNDAHACVDGPLHFDVPVRIGVRQEVLAVDIEIASVTVTEAEAFALVSAPPMRAPPPDDAPFPMRLVVGGLGGGAACAALSAGWLFCGRTSGPGLTVVGSAVEQLSGDGLVTDDDAPYVLLAAGVGVGAGALAAGYSDINASESASEASRLKRDAYAKENARAEAWKHRRAELGLTNPAETH